MIEQHEADYIERSIGNMLGWDSAPMVEVIEDNQIPADVYEAESMMGCCGPSNDRILEFFR